MDTLRRGVVIFAAVVAGMLVTAAPVWAFDLRGNDSVSVGSGEMVNEDLYLAGRTVSSNATVNADMFAVGQTVTIAGAVANGLTVAGQTVVISADVGHGVRAAGSTVDISSAIGRDLLAACGDLVISDSAVVAGDLALGANTAIIRGKVDGNVIGGAEKLVIEGEIGGDVNVQVGTIELKPGATIGGNLTYSGRTEATIPAGTVEGTVAFTERVDDETRAEVSTGLGALAPFLAFWGIVWKLLGYLLSLVTGIILIALLPGPMAAASNALQSKTGRVAGWGAVALFATPLAAIVACITVVGLPIGLISMALWGALLYLAHLPVSLLVGHLILGRSKPLVGKGFMIGRLALGLVVFTLLAAIPFVGVLVWFAAAMFGMGALVIVIARIISAGKDSGQEGPAPYKA